MTAAPEPFSFTGKASGTPGTETSMSPDEPAAWEGFTRYDGEE